VELVSPSSVRLDRSEKKELYARFGVKEYWIGDPADQTLEVFTLKERRYELSCCAKKTGKLASLVLAEVQFDLAEIH
jgi:Uma2 family endonuclease